MPVHRNPDEGFRESNENFDKAEYDDARRTYDIATGNPPGGGGGRENLDANGNISTVSPTDIPAGRRPVDESVVDKYWSKNDYSFFRSILANAKIKGLSQKDIAQIYRLGVNGENGQNTISRIRKEVLEMRKNDKYKDSDTRWIAAQTQAFQSLLERGQGELGESNARRVFEQKTGQVDGSQALGPNGASTDVLPDRVTKIVDNVTTQAVSSAVNSASALPASGQQSFSNGTSNGFMGAPGQEQLTRGPIYNAGGGRIDTEIESNDQGDAVVAGARSVNVAVAGALRSTQNIVLDGETLKPSEEDAQETVLEVANMEWVGEEDLGTEAETDVAHGPLHLQNLQHESIRYGMHCDWPRKADPADGVDEEFMVWTNDMTDHEIRGDLDERISEIRRGMTARKYLETHAMSTLHQDVSRYRNPMELPGISGIESHLVERIQRPPVANLYPADQPCEANYAAQFRDATRNAWRAEY